MRNVIRGTLMATALLMAVAVVYAQRQPGTGGGFGVGPSILSSEDVQKELKLSEDQIKAVQKVGTEMDEKRKEIFKGGKLDRELMQKLSDESKEAYGKVLKGLKPEQQKRYDQLLVQAKGLRAFTDENVQTSLKLTADQKDQLKGLGEDLQKDSTEIRNQLGKDAFRDKDKMAEMQKKITELNTKTMDKVMKVLNEDQKKAWKDLTGDKFEGRMAPAGLGFPGGGGFPGGPGGPGGGKDKGKEKDKKIID